MNHKTLKWLRKLQYFHNCRNFDREYYLGKYQDVAKAEIDPLEHYKKYGRYEGRYVSLADELENTMDQKEYLKRYPDVAKSGMDPVTHYLQFGQAEGRKWVKRDAPKDAIDELKRLINMRYLYNIRNFDREYYLERYPDIAKAKIDPLKHYREHGRYEGRYSSYADELDNKMDQEAYLKKYEDVAKSGINPLIHYLRYGQVEHRPIKIFGSNWETDKNPEVDIHVSDSAEVVAVVLHELSRTGCPINGWNIVKALKKKYNVVVVALQDGPLRKDFEEIADAVIVAPEGIRYNQEKVEKFLEKQISKISFYFCIANSICTYAALPYFARQRVPSLLLVHEFAQYISYEWLKKGFCYATQVVYSSKIVLDATLKKLRINCEIPILPQGISEIPGVKNSPVSQYEENLINQLHQFKSDGNSKIVIAVGQIEYRKGVDLFIKTAAGIKALCHEEKIKFLWIGNGFEPERDYYAGVLQNQIWGYELEEDFIFTGQVLHIDEFYDMADLLLMTSTLDPLPGVVIEAMTNKIPVICFEKCSGFPEYFEKTGLDICIAKYLNTDDMAEKAVKLLQNADLYNKISSKLYNLAKECFNMAIYTSKIMDMMPAIIKANEEDIANIDQEDILAALEEYRTEKLGLLWKSSQIKAEQEKYSALEPVIAGIEKQILTADLSSEELSEFTGENIGNLVYHYAMDHILGGNIPVIPWHEPNKLKNGQIGIFMAANQLGPHVDMEPIYDCIKKQEHPFIIVGLGAQSNKRDDKGNFTIPEIPGATKLWLETIIAHAPTNFPNITLRGRFTHKIMESLGLAAHAVVIGCPSLFINTNNTLGQEIYENIKEPKRIALAAGHQAWRDLDVLESSLMKMVLETNGGYIIQSGLNMIRMARGEWENIPADVYKQMHRHFMPDLDEESFKKYAVKYSKVFGNIPDWINYYRDFDFVVGPRIHGVILAIQAGVPALCVAFDSRTEELCQTMKIPYIIGQDYPQGLQRGDLTRIFLSQFDPDEFDKNRLMLAKKFEEFLANNKIIARNLPGL